MARELRVAGMGESDVDQRIAPIYTRHADVQTTILTAPGEIQIHLRAWTTDTAAAERQLQGIVESIVLALGEAVFTTAGESMEEVVARELTMHHATIATAESCTGGLLAERLTRISGSSAYFLGGVVSYSNTLKSAWVDVPAEIIESRGAVSAKLPSLSPTESAAAPARRWASESPASPAPPEALRKNPWARCTWPSPTPRAARSAASIIPASATASAGKPRKPRWTWCADISCTQGK